MVRFVYFLLLGLFLSPSLLVGQEPVLETIQASLQVGNAKELSQFFGKTVDMTLYGTASNYTKAQAESALRDFFNKNSVRDFRYIHQGKAPTQKISYTIGKLVTDNSSFRVVILLKQTQQSQVIETITFTKEAN